MIGIEFVSAYHPADCGKDGGEHEGEEGAIGEGYGEGGGKGKIVADFNCGGMFRTWVDDGGRERVAVFREEF